MGSDLFRWSLSLLPSRRDPRLLSTAEKETLLPFWDQAAQNLGPAKITKHRLHFWCQKLFVDQWPSLHFDLFGVYILRQNRL